MKFLLTTTVGAFVSLWILCGGDWSLITDTEDIRWVVAGDRAFGFLGWLDYLRHDWSLPLSTSSHYLYPLPVNLALTDSVPLWAFLAKALSPDNFSIWQPYSY